MTEHLYLVVEKAKRGWRSVRIAKVSKKRPTLPRPTEQAIVKLRIDIPDTIMEPREILVAINKDHVVPPQISVASQPAQA